MAYNLLIPYSFVLENIGFNAMIFHSTSLWLTQVMLNSDEKKYGGQALIGQDQYIQRTISKR